jgi:hypothetical protein
VSSADAWYEDEETRNADDMESLLALSVELVETMNAAMREVEMDPDLEAAKQRHPSGKMVQDTPASPHGTPLAVLNALDRCDQGCGAAALYRVASGRAELDFCHHHKNKLFPAMEAEGWSVIGTNPSLMDELYANRLKGADHA